MLNRINHTVSQKFPTTYLGRGLSYGILLSVMATYSSFAAQSTSQPYEIASNSTRVVPSTEKVIIDTDIGFDIDDAFAVALALRTPELEILGFSTASGDTLARAKIIDRMLGDSGHSNIPVAVGIPTQASGADLPDGLVGLQKRYGQSSSYARVSHPAAVDFIAGKIRQYPGQITLVTIGPLSNVGALIERDPVTFRKLKRVVMMGGWIGPIDDDEGPHDGPKPEYNITGDIRASQLLFRSGVPLFMMPIDSTIELKLDEVKRKLLFSQATPITDSLGLLYLLWGNTTPILFDVMAVAFTTEPSLCPVTPMHIDVDDTGVTRVTDGPANVEVCLHSDPNGFLAYFMDRVIGEREGNSNLAAKE